ncbi:hypothetical protein Goari_014893 [Gossypium aridum]|uniref:Disease resistance protein At4g27190-like leucine-rich repeats domain-containing protein n=1 Tax=Gossypium aridum TaxID=34290 RepID=A0A7J8XJ59_GOSAI|nr:hypothetical protein [Gossypium aridum]
MAKYLVHLKHFEITACNILREIIFSENIIEEESQAATVLSLFPQLKSLELKDLPHLSGFCSNSQNKVIEFPFLKSMTIYNCPILEGFICRYTSEGNQRISSHGDLFDNKFRGNGVSYLIKMKMLWRNPLPPNSFPKLQELRVERSSIAQDLPQLGYLDIFHCGVEEIVSKLEEGSDWEATVNFKFDRLCTLALSNLPKLKCFYSGKHIAKWPMLNKLEVVECGKMKIFGTQLNTNNGQLDSSIPPPLFLVEKV